MADGSPHRTVPVERVTQGAFTVTDTRGDQVTFGTGSDTSCMPTELLLGAIAGCTAIDIDILTLRRAERGQVPSAGRRGQGQRCRR